MYTPIYVKTTSPENNKKQINRYEQDPIYGSQFIKILNFCKENNIPYGMGGCSDGGISEITKIEIDLFDVLKILKHYSDHFPDKTYPTPGINVKDK